jgi:hypothetical protein
LCCRHQPPPVPHARIRAATAKIPKVVAREVVYIAILIHTLEQMCEMETSDFVRAESEVPNPKRSKPYPSPRVTARDDWGSYSVYHWYCVSLTIGRRAPPSSYKPRHMLTPYVAPKLRQGGATGSAGKKILATTANKLGPAPVPPKDKFWEELARRGSIASRSSGSMADGIQL